MTRAAGGCADGPEPRFEARGLALGKRDGQRASHHREVLETRLREDREVQERVMGDTDQWGVTGSRCASDIHEVKGTDHGIGLLPPGRRRSLEVRWL